MSRAKTTRRDFLLTTGATLATATLAPEFGTTRLGAQAPAAKPFGYAVVGLGNLAEGSILPAFAHATRSRVTGLISGDRAKALEIGAKYNVPEKGVYTYDTFDQIADNPDIDAVYIVLPNGLHAEYAIRAHKAGKHVLVEKPMANTVADCDAMIAAAKEANRLLLVAYRLRYEPHTIEMIRMTREREFGPAKALFCEAGFNIGDPTQWRLNKAMAGGGSMMDIGIYAVNAARYLSGENPAEIFAYEFTDRSDPRFKEVEDTVAFQMRFPSGLVASCLSSYGTSLNKFLVHAQRGSYEMSPAWNSGGLRLTVLRGRTPQVRDLPQIDHFAAMMDHLAECAATGTTPLTPGEDGRHDMRVIEAIYESVRTNRPVHLT